MFSLDQYALLDFGHGRRLERFGALVLDRPCPAAEGVAKGDPALWEQADARFVRTEGKLGQWVSDRHLPERWTITYGKKGTGTICAKHPPGRSGKLYLSPFSLELKRTEFGHLGVFPEQAANWDWLVARRVRETHQPDLSDHLPPPRVLNLFAYTGASTLAAAAAGAEVVHVDAARNVVAWARRNAELSGLADAPIRWITEDAMKFVKRELRRGNRYDAAILDPPSYGHGRRGEVWRLSKHLPQLLRMLADLTAGRCQWLLLTCHTPKFDPERLERLVYEKLGAGRVSGEQMTLETPAGRRLPSGVVVRWQAAS
jgi:23S rRNA (cytosine1962-C5)-methyltransferase